MARASRTDLEQGAVLMPSRHPQPRFANAPGTTPPRTRSRSGFGDDGHAGACDVDGVGEVGQGHLAFGGRQGGSKGFQVVEARLGDAIGHRADLRPVILDVVPQVREAHRERAVRLPPVPADPIPTQVVGFVREDEPCRHGPITYRSRAPEWMVFQCHCSACHGREGARVESADDRRRASRRRVGHRRGAGTDCHRRRIVYSTLWLVPLADIPPGESKHETRSHERPRHRGGGTRWST